MKSVNKKLKDLPFNSNSDTETPSWGDWRLRYVTSSDARQATLQIKSVSVGKALDGENFFFIEFLIALN